jgi:hypothetical protein
VSLAVACSDGSDYAFRLKHDAATHAYLMTVKSKQGIGVDDFPVAYVEGQGWKGTQIMSLLSSREARNCCPTLTSSSASVRPIHGSPLAGSAPAA